MSDDFSSFDIEDFAFDESFQLWVAQGDNGPHHFWDQYLIDHPHQTAKIMAAKQLVLMLASDKVQSRDEDFVKTMWTNIYKRIEKEPIMLWQRFAMWRVAASISILLIGAAGGIWFWQANSGVFSFTSSFVSSDKIIRDTTNNSTGAINIQLSDGSVVSLAKNSRLTYPENFNSNERTVQLKGEAFFEVKKNPASPFIIYANKTVTKVLGTSFNIAAYDDSPKIIVAVRTGKVSVFDKNIFDNNKQNADLEGIMLLPNQQAEYVKENEKFSKTLVENPEILNLPSKDAFNFNQTPLKEVFKTLQEAYGVEIIYDKSLVSNRSLKVNLEGESFFEKLNLICKTMNLKYQIIDSKVLLEKSISI